MTAFTPKFGGWSPLPTGQQEGRLYYVVSFRQACRNLIDGSARIDVFRFSEDIGPAESGRPTRPLGPAFFEESTNGSVAILQEDDKIEPAQAGVAQW
jgi:hypothetical protein